MNQLQVHQELEKQQQVKRELKRLCINEDIKYEQYKKIAEEKVRHYKRLNGLKLKRQMEEQALYQDIQDRHQYIQYFIKSHKHIERINEIAKAINDDYIINFKETKKHYSIGIDRNLREGFCKDPVLDIREPFKENHYSIGSDRNFKVGKSSLTFFL